MRSQIPRSGGFSGPSTATAPSGESGEHAPWWIARQSAASPGNTRHGGLLGNRRAGGPAGKIGERPSGSATYGSW